MRMMLMLRVVVQPTALKNYYQTFSKTSQLTANLNPAVKLLPPAAASSRKLKAKK